jgi:hypothetical protein
MATGAYSMHLGGADATRLTLLGQFYDPASSAFRKAAGVRPGDSIVDLGCGHGGVPKPANVTTNHAHRGRVVAQRLTGHARTLFEGDYVRGYITLGYAGTVHSAQGMTVGNSTTCGVCWTILSDRASGAMAYVGITRARDENHLAIYPAVTNEAHKHQQPPNTGIRQTQRGTNRAAAQALYALLTNNDDHARCRRRHRPGLPTCPR